MKKLEIISPSVQKFDLKEGLISKFSHQLFVDESLGVNLPVNHSIFMFLTEKSDDGRFKMPFDVNAIFSKPIAENLHRIKAKIGQCSQIAENLFGALKYCNDKFKLNPDLNTFFQKVEERYSKLDFMGHRDILSNIIKSQKVDWLNGILLSYDKKSVTKSFNSFILDRNKYTHGEVMYWYPEKKTLLEYQNENGEVEYGEVNQLILNSFLQCYQELDQILNQIKTASNN